MDLKRGIKNDHGSRAHNAPVSILMPTYNRARYIGEAIKSVLVQTYQNWELIIIDDGSTDDTPATVAHYNDSRIRYIRHDENRGLLARRQESVSYAAGTYVAILDSDDVWLDRDKLARQIARLETDGTCVLVGTAITRIDEQSHKIGETHYETSDAKIRNKILRRNQFAHSSILTRRLALSQTAGYRFSLAEDLDLFLQLGQHGTLANLPEPMTGYRVHGESETNRQLTMIKTVLKIINLHRDQYPHYHYGYLKYSLYARWLSWFKNQHRK